jgi:hypothetical protein
MGSETIASCGGFGAGGGVVAGTCVQLDKQMAMAANSVAIGPGRRNSMFYAPLNFSFVRSGSSARSLL